MNAVRVVFPRTGNLFCVWRIEKNILANYKLHFDKEEDWIVFLSTWIDLINSSDESSFNEALRDFKVQYEKKELVLNYCKNTWLPFKEHFVVTGIDKFLYF